MRLEKKYIELVYDDETQLRLLAYCKAHGFDLTKSFSGEEIAEEEFDFHSTIWYTTTEHDLENGTKRIEPFEVYPVGFELFGENQNVLVMTVESEVLTTIRRRYGLLYQMRDMWPSYRPHISFDYNYSGNVKNMMLPDFPIVANIINIKSQKQ